MEKKDIEEITMLIEEGAYFKEARSWYSRVNLALMSERVFYIVLTTIAALVFLIAIISLMRLLPIKPAKPFIYTSKSGETTIARLMPLSKNNGETPDEALRRYFVTEYIKRRESYSMKTLSSNMLYVYRHSDDKTAAAFQRYMDKSNNRSPVVMYQAAAERVVEIKKVNITPKGDQRYASEVDFEAKVVTMAGETLTKHHANIEFYYKDIGVPQDVEKPKEKAKNIFEMMSKVKVTPMEFQVRGYSVILRKSDYE